MARGINKGMVDMYVGLAESEFKPLITVLQRKNEHIKDQVETAVKKDWGIYDLFLEQEAHEIRLEEIRCKLKEFTKEKWNGYGASPSKIDDEVESRLLAMNEPLRKALEAKKEAIRDIQFMSAGQDIKDIFDKLSATVAMLTQEYAALPNARPVPQLNA